MLPGLPKEMRDVEIDDREIARVEAIIHSMTPRERTNPRVINGSRRQRIAKGSGTTTAQVNQLLRQFDQMAKMMKKMGPLAGALGRGKKGKKGRRAKGAGPTPPTLPQLPSLPGRG
jgi:signal recognition particle subunit SRP54